MFLTSPKQLSSLRIRAHLSWRTGKHLHVLHVLRTYSTCSYPGYQDTTTYAALPIQRHSNCIVSILEELKFHRVGVNLQKAMKCTRMAFRFILLSSVHLSGAEDSLGKRGLVQKVWEVLKGKIAILGDTMTDDTT